MSSRLRRWDDAFHGWSERRLPTTSSGRLVMLGFIFLVLGGALLLLTATTSTFGLVGMVGLPLMGLLFVLLGLAQRGRG